MKRIFIVYLISTVMAVSAFAEESYEVQAEHDRHFFYKELNFLYNPYGSSMNPILLSYNRVKSVANAEVNTHFERGDFHAMDQSSRHNDFNVSIYGLRNFGRLDVEGTISYRNLKDYAHQWNSTLFLSSGNPFVLCDSVPSDVSSEQFSMRAAAAYRFSDFLRAGLSLDYVTGSSADQTDPRPKTNSMRFNLRPGIGLRLNATHAVGVSALVGFYRSDITHAVINTDVSQTLFLMKGMGDHLSRPTNDFSSYPRDYKGHRYGIGLQWAFNRGSVNNFVEVLAETNSEDALDGGSAYTFRGGDYREKKISLYDRFNWHANERMQHNLSLRADYGIGNGYWYDQKRLVDPDHGNINYYQILNKAKVRDSHDMNLALTYHFDYLRNLLPDFRLKTTASIHRFECTQYESAAFKQSYTLGSVLVDGSKWWNVRSCKIGGTIGGHYSFPVGNSEFASVKQNISARYTAPAFEQESASRVGFQVGLSADLPINIYNNATWVGIYANMSTDYYMGSSEYSSLFSSTSRTEINAGIRFIF